MRLLYSIFGLTIFLSACSEKIVSQQVLKDVQELSLDKYQGRKTGTEGNRMAAAYITERFEQIGLRPYKEDYRKTFQFTDRSGTVIQGTNLIGYIPGKKPDVIVVSAHYDHIGVIGRQVYNGADDNASGVGGLLAIASYFSKHPPEHTLVFAAFDAEESGLQGAKAFVAKPEIALTSIKLNVNMDMISRSDKNELYVAGTYHYPQLAASIVNTNPAIKVLRGHDDPKTGSNDWTNQSDQGAFHEKKIPFLYFGVEDHADYHKPGDDFKNIHTDFYQLAVNAILEIVKNLDKGITIQKVFRDKLIMTE